MIKEKISDEMRDGIRDIYFSQIKSGGFIIRIMEAFSVSIESFSNRIILEKIIEALHHYEIINGLLGEILEKIPVSDSFNFFNMTREELMEEINNITGREH